MSLWLIGWTVGCVFLLVGALGGEHFLWLFGVPFWASWLFVAFMLLDNYFGKEYLTINTSGASYRKIVLVTVKQLDVLSEDVIKVRSFRKTEDNESNTFSYGLEIQTQGKPIRFGKGLPKDELRYLKYRIREALHLNSERQLVKTQTGDNANAVPKIRKFPWVVTMGDQAVPEPTQTMHQIEVGTSDVTLRDKFLFASGAQNIMSWLAGLGGVTFINLFWNGIVSVFLVALIAPDFLESEGEGEGLEDWGRIGLAVFLIPFVVIGLFMIFGWVMTLLGPWIRETWRFDDLEINKRTAILGFGKTKRTDTRDIDRLEIHEDSNSEKNSESNKSLNINFGRPRKNRFTSDEDQEQGTQYRLAFINRDNEVATEIEALTLAEARWIGDHLISAFPQWDATANQAMLG